MWIEIFFSPIGPQPEMVISKHQKKKTRTDSLSLKMFINYHANECPAIEIWFHCTLQSDQHHQVIFLSFRKCLSFLKTEKTKSMMLGLIITLLQSHISNLIHKQN